MNMKLGLEKDVLSMKLRRYGYSVYGVYDDHAESFTNTKNMLFFISQEYKVCFRSFAFLCDSFLIR